MHPGCSASELCAAGAFDQNAAALLIRIDARVSAAIGSLGLASVCCLLWLVVVWLMVLWISSPKGFCPDQLPRARKGLAIKPKHSLALCL
jgi:hypothetical protein